MNWWTSIILFFVILFFYVHIQQQWKKGEDLEIYEYEFQNPKELQDTCQWKQPILFEMEFPKPYGFSQLPQLQMADVREIRHLSSQSPNIELIDLTAESARGLLDTDTKSVFYSYRNSTAVKEHPEWNAWFRTWEPLLKPPFCMSSEYDVWYGSRKTTTITMTHHESHTYLYLPPETNPAAIRVKMTPPKSEVFLETKRDYVSYEFWSPVDLFHPHDRMKCLDFLMKPGFVLYIPPYWFYSIEFQDKKNEVCMVKYTTGANFLANAKHIALYHLQQQNIEEKWWKPLQNTELPLISLPSPDDDVDDEPPPVSSSSLEKMPKPNDSSSAPEDLERTAVEQLVEELKVKTENRIHVS